MYKASILLSDIETVKKFVSLTSQYDFPVTLYSDKYVISGKSIMGIFGLDLSIPLEVEVPSNCPDDFKEKLKEFSVPVQVNA